MAKHTSYERKSGRQSKRHGRYETNPAISAAQYGMAQTVVSGISEAIPLDVAQEIIAKTPGRLRSAYAKMLASVRGKRNRNRKGNPEDVLDEATEMAEKFHGRPAREVLEVEEIEEYDGVGAVIGDLLELNILVDEGSNVVPINWEQQKISDRPKVVCDPQGKNICFIGGDQNLELDRLMDVYEEYETKKNLILVGPVCSIAYFSDKHHLEGPKEQKNGIPYEHEFGEEGGELPDLVYDCRNKKMWLIGGSYTVEDVGIRN